MSARIIAEIGADVSGFESGLNRAEGLADKFKHKVTHHFAKAFGVGMFAGAVFRGFEQRMEMASKIEEESAKLHTTSDEYQMLTAAAKDAGMETEEFIKSNAKNGVMLDTLIRRVESYRSSIKMTRDELSEWKEFKGHMGAITEGMSAPLNWLIRKGSSLAGMGMDLFGAVGDTLLKGATFGKLGFPSDASDYLHDLGARLGYFDQDSGSKALPLPSGYGQTRKFKELTDNLRLLGLQEQDLKREQGTHYSLMGPNLTDREEAGAYVSRPSMIVTEQQQTNEKLDSVREEIQRTKEEIQKLRTGEGG